MNLRNDAVIEKVLILYIDQVSFFGIVYGIQIQLSDASVSTLRSGIGLGRNRPQHLYLNSVGKLWNLLCGEGCNHILRHVGMPDTRAVKALDEISQNVAGSGALDPVKKVMQRRKILEPLEQVLSFLHTPHIERVVFRSVPIGLHRIYAADESHDSASTVVHDVGLLMMAP